VVVRDQSGRPGLSPYAARELLSFRSRTGRVQRRIYGALYHAVDLSRRHAPGTGDSCRGLDPCLERLYVPIHRNLGQASLNTSRYTRQISQRKGAVGKIPTAPLSVSLLSDFLLSTSLPYRHRPASEASSCPLPEGLRSSRMW